MESGTPGKTGNGWLNRALVDKGSDSSPLRAVALSNRVPRTLRGEHEAIALGNVQEFRISDQDRMAILKNMYSSTTDAALRRTGTDAFEAMKMLQSMGNDAPLNPEARAVLGAGEGVPVRNNRPSYDTGGQLGRNLRELARLIKSDAGVEAAFAEVDGWDHHQNENQQLPNLLNQFSNGIAAFCQDLGDRMEDVVIVTMSEFGRTAEENGNGGTDHGHGSLMMVLGGPVKGGKVYGLQAHDCTPAGTGKNIATFALRRSRRLVPRPERCPKRASRSRLCTRSIGNFPCSSPASDPLIAGPPFVVWPLCEIAIGWAKAVSGPDEDETREVWIWRINRWSWPHV